VRPDNDTWALEIAQTVSERSTCSRLHVGAILVKHGIVLGAGYNGAPRKMAHCVHTDDTPCRLSIHAEINALVHSGLWNSQGAVMYITHAPCWDCAKMIVQHQISKVVFREVYRNREGLDMLDLAGVQWEQKRNTPMEGTK